MRLAREEKKGRFIAMITIFVCLTAVFIFTLNIITLTVADDYLTVAVKCLTSCCFDLC